MGDRRNLIQLMTIVAEMEREGGLRVVIVGGETFFILTCEAFIVNMMICRWDDGGSHSLLSQTTWA